MNGDVADTASRRELLLVDQPYANHNGGEVTFGRDGMLYITLGDGGSEGDPQATCAEPRRSCSARSCASIRPRAATRRIRYPADNPFVGHAGARPEIWMYGLRNPWRFSFDRATDDVWIGDVGQNAWEEIDFAAAGTGAGSNWGWNAREGTHQYEGPAPTGARDPIFELSHSDGNCAVTGGYVYRGAAIPALRGAYVFADYCVGELTALVQRDGALADQALLGAQTSEVTSFGEDAGRRALRALPLGKHLPHRPGCEAYARSTVTAATRRVTANGATLERPAAIRFIAPGTITALFLARPSRPARATGSASCQRKLGTLFGSNDAVALELGLRESGREHRHRDTRALQLLVHRLRERQHEGLRGRVGRVVRRRLEAGQRRDVQDRAPAARHHAAGGRVREPDHGEHVQADLAVFGVEVELVEIPERTEAGVVDQRVDVGGARFDAREIGRFDQVGGEHLAMVPVLGFELLRQCIESSLVARDEHEVVAPLGEQPGELLTDPE